MSRLSAELAAYEAQAGAAADWLAALPDADFAAPSVLPGWDVRTLVGHLAASKAGLVEGLRPAASRRRPRPSEYVRAYRPAADAITAVTKQLTGDQTPAELIAQLREPVAAPDGVADGTVVAGPRGSITALDFARVRVLDLVVHCDDLSRSLPERDPMPLPRAGLGSTGAAARRDPRGAGARTLGRGARAAVHRGAGDRRAAAHARHAAERRGGGSGDMAAPRDRPRVVRRRGRPWAGCAPAAPAPTSAPYLPGPVLTDAFGT